MYGDQSREFVLISVNIGPCPKRGGGELPYKRNGDARRLALGCKLQLLVSLRVFGIESLYICPFKYRLVLCIKKFTKKCALLDFFYVIVFGNKRGIRDFRGKRSCNAG